MKLFSSPLLWAVFATACIVGGQYYALNSYVDKLAPIKAEVTHVTQEDPRPLKWSFTEEHVDALRNELGKRLAALEVRESELAARETRMLADRAEIDDIINEVETMRQTFLADVVRLELEEARNLKTLAKTYSSLDAKATVSIFSELDDTTVVKIMFHMKSDIVGEILQEMAKQGGQNEDLLLRAAKLSEMLRLFTDNTKELNANT